jgi:hypothetical protein
MDTSECIVKSVAEDDDEQMYVTKFKEEVGNYTKERVLGHSIQRPMEYW